MVFPLTVISSAQIAVPASGPTVYPNAGATIPISLQINPNLGDKDPELIDKIVKGQVEALVGQDPVLRAWARNALIVASVGGGMNAPASGGYLLAYTGALNKYLLQHVGEHDLAARLNIAIVVARVAEHDAKDATEASLTPVILKLLNDKSDSVVLWAMKGAAAVSPVLLSQVPSNQTVIKVIGGAVAAHGYFGPITEEAYNAMSPPTPAPAAIVEFIKLFAARVALYDPATPDKLTPDDPSVEGKAAQYLTATANWPVLSAPQQAQVVQTIYTMLAKLQRCLDCPVAIDHQAEMFVNIKRACACLVVVAGNVNSNTNLAGAATGLNNITPPTSNNSGTPVNTVKDLLTPVLTNLQAAFPAIKPLPAPVAAPSTTTAP